MSHYAHTLMIAANNAELNGLHFLASALVGLLRVEIEKERHGKRCYGRTNVSAEAAEFKAWLAVESDQQRELFREELRAVLAARVGRN